MTRVMHTLLALCKEEDAQDLVEYALVVALISLGTVAAMNNLAASIGSAFSVVGSTITSNV